MQVDQTQKYLLEDDLLDLHRFIETTTDGEGFDVPKDRMKRLIELGVVYSSGFGRYGVTAFGYYVHELSWEQKPTLPLLLNSDRDRIARESRGAA